MADGGNGILPQILSTIDSTKRSAGLKMQTAVADPGQYMTQLLTDVGNTLEKSFGPNATAEDVIGQLGLGGITVFHGSPYSGIKKFDSSKIGTGEGAQVYGRGHYVAENIGTGKYYQKNLSVIKDDFLGQASALERQLSDPRLSVEESKIMRKQVIDLRAKANAMPDGGVLYKGELPDNSVGKMLDWNKPLSDQKDILDSLGITDKGLRQIKLIGGDGDSVSSLMKAMTASTGSEQKAIDYLNSKGIPGIKYFDALSRNDGAQAAHELYPDKFPAPPPATSNYVIFDDDLIKSLEEMK